MAVIAAAATVHAPLIVGMPMLAPADKRELVDGGFGRLRDFVAEAAPDLIVTIASEHITNFLAEDCPSFAVSTAPANPVQPEFGLPVLDITSDADFARLLLEVAVRNGVPMEGREILRLDHGTNLPLSYMTPSYDVPVVPIIVNTVWQPLPTMAETVALGRSIAEAAEASGKTVLVLGTGGISHWVGNRRHGDMNV